MSELAAAFAESGHGGPLLQNRARVKVARLAVLQRGRAHGKPSLPQNARRLAAQTADSEADAGALKMAGRYERLATGAANREKVLTAAAWEQTDP
jgi:hypothetical protein